MGRWPEEWEGEGEGEEFAVATPSASAMIYELLAPPSSLSRTPGQNPTKVRLPCVQRVHRWWSRNAGGETHGTGARTE